MSSKCGTLCDQRGRKRFIASWGLRMSHICPCTPCPSPQGYRSKVESRHFAHHCQRANDFLRSYDSASRPPPFHSPVLSLPVCRRSVLLMGGGSGGIEVGEESNYMTARKPGLYKSLNTLWCLLYFCSYVGTLPPDVGTDDNLYCIRTENCVNHYSAPRFVIQSDV